MSDEARDATEEMMQALKSHDEEVLAPLRQAYAEERETLVREHRHQELAVFDALEVMREIESSCRDECTASQVREVIADLEAVF